MFSRCFHLRRGAMRAAIALTTSLALSICMLGVPLPVRSEKQADEPFPCMHCACSCTAETCWRHCCCYTHEQKLAWARKHGVVPPAYVLASSHRRSLRHGSCCKKSHAPEQPRRKTSHSTIIMLQAYRCQGLASALTLFPPVVLTAKSSPGNFPEGLTQPVATVVPLYFGPVVLLNTPPPQNDVLSQVVLS